MSGRHSRGRTGRGPLAPPGGRPAPAPSPTGRSRPGPVPGRRPGAPGLPGPPGFRVPVAAAAGSRAIFRKEALEFHTRSREPQSGVVRLGAPWLRWTYRLTLGLVAAGIAVASVAQVRQSSYGSAVVNPGSGRFAAVFPAGVVPDLAGAKGLGFALPGEGLRAIPVTGLHLTLASGSAVSRAGLPMPDQPSILLTGQLPAAAVPPMAAASLHTSAVVILPARSLAAVLGHELNVMLGQSRAGS